MCGKALGGIWVDGANGSKIYISVKCNVPHHPYDPCYYFDNRTGGKIVPGLIPDVSVDDRGCVIEKSKSKEAWTLPKPFPELGISQKMFEDALTEASRMSTFFVMWIGLIRGWGPNETVKAMGTLRDWC